jgi:hypothetical protein
MTHAPIGSLERELERTADMLPKIAAEQGVYYVVAFLLDSGYDRIAMRRIMEILEKQPGARLNGN